MATNSHGELLLQAPIDGLARVSDFNRLGVPLRPSTVWQRLHEGRFPEPDVRVPGLTAWRYSTLQRYLNDLQSQPRAA